MGAWSFVPHVFTHTQLICFFQLNQVVVLDSVAKHLHQVISETWLFIRSILSFSLPISFFFFLQLQLEVFDLIFVKLRILILNWFQFGIQNWVDFSISIFLFLIFLGKKLSIQSRRIILRNTNFENGVVLICEYTLLGRQLQTTREVVVFFL